MCKDSAYLNNINPVAIWTLTLKNYKEILQTTKIKECNSNPRYSILLLLFCRIDVICNGYVNHRVSNQL